MSRETPATGAGPHLERALHGTVQGGPTQAPPTGTLLNHLQHGATSLNSLPGARGSRPSLHACRDHLTSEDHSPLTSSPLPLTSPHHHHTTLVVFLHASCKTSSPRDIPTTGLHTLPTASTTPRSSQEKWQALLHTTIPTRECPPQGWGVTAPPGAEANIQTLVLLLPMASTVTPHTCARDSHPFRTTPAWCPTYHTSTCRPGSWHRWLNWRTVTTNP